MACDDCVGRDLYTTTICLTYDGTLDAYLPLLFHFKCCFSPPSEYLYKQLTKVMSLCYLSFTHMFNPKLDNGNLLNTKFI